MAYSLAGFNGQRPDPVSGHYHLGNGYRAYSPVLGRFTSPDDMSPFGPGGVNPYAYCAGDPVNRADPSGHFSLGQGIGMALGFLAGIALSILTEGAAMPVALTLMATVAGDAAIGAGAELATEAIDGQRISWGQAGIAAGMSAAASLVGFGVGKGISRAFRGMKNISSAVNGAAYSAEQVNAWDRVATRGLGQGGLRGGARRQPPRLTNMAIDTIISDERLSEAANAKLPSSLVNRLDMGREIQEMVQNRLTDHLMSINDYNYRENHFQRTWLRYYHQNGQPKWFGAVLSRVFENIGEGEHEVSGLSSTYYREFSPESGVSHRMSYSDGRMQDQITRHLFQKESPLWRTKTEIHNSIVNWPEVALK